MRKPVALLAVYFVTIAAAAYAQSTDRVPSAQQPPAQQPQNLPPKQQKSQKPATLIVFDLIAEKGIEKGVTNLLTELIINRVSAMKKYEVVGQKDLDKMLSWEQSKQLKGCTDTKCLIQLAGAMGAEFYVEGSVGVVGDQYLVTLKLMDANNVKVVERETIRVVMDEKILADTMERLVDKIMGLKVDLKGLPGSAADAEASARQAAVARAAAKARQERRSQLKIAGITCTFAGLGVVVLGGVFNGLAANETGREKSAKDPSTLNDARDKAGAYGTAAIAGYSLGGAALVAGVVMWVVSARSPGPVSAAIDVAPVFGPEGGGVMVGGAW